MSISRRLSLANLVDAHIRKQVDNVCARVKDDVVVDALHLFDRVPDTIFFLM